jgi:hypothetical protein
MGTNYYLTEKICPTCGRGNRLHIGKSSYGWCFALHVIPEMGIDDIGDWRAHWTRPDSLIEDEYGDKLTPEEMESKILQRSHPKGLERSPIDGVHCVGHGVGTYDLIAGEFT